MTFADFTIQQLVMRLFAGLIIFTIQGAAIAVAAELLGDKGPGYDSRITLMPFGHIDMLGLGSLMLSGYGWGRPVAIEAGKLRLGRWGLLVPVLAGSTMLLILGYLLLFLVGPLLSFMPYTAGLATAAFIRVAARICVWIALFSLLPIPPLVGRYFLTSVGIAVPKRAGTYLSWVLFAASISGLTRWALTPAYQVIAPFVLGSTVAG